MKVHQLLRLTGPESNSMRKIRQHRPPGFTPLELGIDRMLTLMEFDDARMSENIPLGDEHREGAPIRSALVKTIHWVFACKARCLAEIRHQEKLVRQYREQHDKKSE